MKISEAQFRRLLQPVRDSVKAGVSVSPTPDDVALWLTGHKAAVHAMKQHYIRTQNISSRTKEEVNVVLNHSDQLVLCAERAMECWGYVEVPDYLHGRAKYRGMVEKHGWAKEYETPELCVDSILDFGDLLFYVKKVCAVNIARKKLAKKDKATTR